MVACVFYIFSLLHILFVVSASKSLKEEENGQYVITVPDIPANWPEVYLCTGMKLNITSAHYIVKFEPRATMDKVHHMVLYGCKTPGSTEPIWNCAHEGNFAEKIYETNSPCGSKSTVMYAWARNATTVNLPEEVGFKISGDSTTKYLVLNIHFSATNKEHDGSSSDGTPTQLVLHYSRKRQRRLAGIFFLGTNGMIPPKSTAVWDSACKIVEDQTIYPFAFRVHTHHYGTVVAGYRVRPDRNGIDRWTQIGRKNPQKAHMFYPVDNNITITKGDTIAARCSYYNGLTTIMVAGSDDDHEMCNYYVMYYVEHGNPLQMRLCWTPNNYRWESELNNIPADASFPE